MRNHIPCEVMEVDRVASDIFCITLRLDINEFRYRPGQYINLSLPDGKPRSFSIAGGRTDCKTIELHIRDSGSGFVENVLSTQDTADSLYLDGPHGSLYYREQLVDAGDPIILLASGTGFSSIKSILEQLSQSSSPNQIYLFWGARYKSDLYLLDWVEELSRSMTQLTFVPVLREPRPEDHWLGRVGNVHEAVMEEFPDMRCCHVYACGSPILIETSRRDFAEQCGLPYRCFHA